MTPWSGDKRGLQRETLATRETRHFVVKRELSNPRHTQTIGKQHKWHPGRVTNVDCKEKLQQPAKPQKGLQREHLATRDTPRQLENNTNGALAG